MDAKIVKNFVSEVIWRMLRENGMSQKELSDFTGISTVSINRLIRGKYVPTLSTFLNIVQFLSTRKYNSLFMEVCNRGVIFHTRLNCNRQLF